MKSSRLHALSTALGTATALAVIGSSGCGGKLSEEAGSTGQALSGADAGSTITISGTVTDPNDGPQAGITITLSGSANAQVVTTFSGSFSFKVAPGGSYSLTAQGSDNFFAPPFHSCLTITPSVVNLNNLTASTNIQFVGSGTDQVLNCSPPEAMGAFTGPFTISGVVTSHGLPVAGARVLLNGSTQAFRTTDETGAYSFSVSAGSYSVDPTGGNCASFTPTVANLNNLKASATENFQATGCPPAPLTLCPTFDKLLGLSEPASCNTTSTVACEVDRLNSWAGEIVNDFQFVEGDELALNDCRFGKWQAAPIVNDFTFVGVLEQQTTNLDIFTLQLFGCAAVNNLIGPLNLLGSLVPPDLIQKGLKFTTADVSALEDEYMAAINQALADFGLGPMTPAQASAIRAQLDFAASKTPGLVASSTLSYSTCAADAGAE